MGKMNDNFALRLNTTQREPIFYFLLQPYIYLSILNVIELVVVKYEKKPLLEERISMKIFLDIICKKMIRIS